MGKFGEYLVQNKYISQELLDKCLIIQENEDKKGYHRMIGHILLSECMHDCSKDKLYNLIREWEKKEDK